MPHDWTDEQCQLALPSFDVDLCLFWYGTCAFGFDRSVFRGVSQCFAKDLHRGAIEKRIELFSLGPQVVRTDANNDMFSDGQREQVWRRWRRYPSTRHKVHREVWAVLPQHNKLERSVPALACTTQNNKARSLVTITDRPEGRHLSSHWTRPSTLLKGDATLFCIP